MRVVIRRESPGLVAQHRRSRRGLWMGAAVATASAALSTLVILERPAGDAAGWLLAGLIMALLIVAAVAWARSTERSRRARVRGSLWQSRLAAHVGPHGAEGLWALTSMANLAKQPGAIVFVALTPRSFEVVPVQGLPETVSIPLTSVASVDLVFGASRNQRGFSIRLTDGKRADFIGKPDLRLAEHLRSLGAEVVADSTEVADTSPDDSPRGSGRMS